MLRRGKSGWGFNFVRLLSVSQGIHKDERERIRRHRKWIAAAVILPALLELSTIPVGRIFPWGGAYEAICSAISSVTLILAAFIFMHWTARILSAASLLLIVAVACLILEATLRAVTDMAVLQDWPLFRADSPGMSDLLYALELGTLLSLFIGLFLALTDERLAKLALAERGDAMVEGLQRQIDGDRALRGLVEATAEATGKEFFNQLAASLAASLDVEGVFISKYAPENPGKELHTLALWDGSRLAPPDPFPIEATPCREVIELGVLRFIPSNVSRMYQKDLWLSDRNMESYLGMPMYSSSGKVLGHIAVMSSKPMQADPQRERVMRLFADRAGVELERMGQEARLRDQALIIESAQDSIITVDIDGKILSWNRGSERIYGYTAEEAVGQSMAMLVPDELDFIGSFKLSASAGETVQNARVTRLRKDGKQIYVSLSTFPVHDAEGTVIAYSGIAREITSEIEQERALRESESRLRMFFTNVPDIITVVNLDGTISYSNRSGGQRPAQELAGKKVMDFVPEEYQPAAKALLDYVVANRATQTIELPSAVSGKFFRVSVVPIVTDGTVTELMLISRDVTERIEQERALRESEATLRGLFENVPDLIRVLTPEGIIKFANHTYWEMKPEDLVGTSIFDFVPEEKQEESRAWFAEVVRTGQPATSEQRGVKTGKVFLTRLVPIVTENGQVEEVLMVGTDVTEQRAQEDTLRRTRDEFQFLAEHMNDVVWQIDRDFRFTYVGPSVERVTGYTVEECLGQPWTFNVHSDHAARVSQIVEQALRSRTDEAVFDLSSFTKSGEMIIYDVSMVAVRDEEGRFAGLQGMARDITERRRAENALREREALYRVIIETSHEGICMLSQDNRVVFVNSRMAEMMKYTPIEMVGRNIADLIIEKHREQGADVLRRLRKDSALNFEFPFRAKDGTIVWTDVAASQVRGDDGALRGVIGMVTDISERKRAEDEKRELEVQVQHAQKLESLGVLAGGIAHDFNNLLAGIMGYASLLAQDLNGDDARLGYVQKIELASNRAAELTKQMLAYSGKGKFVLEQLDLSRLTTEMLDLIHASISKKAETIFELSDDLPPVRGDSAQISQVIMNLIINASDALEDRPGTITIRTRVVQASESLLRRSVVQSENVKAGTYVSFETIDNGCGMDQETVKRIFDPFFTTKFTGRGLGLAAALGIVRGHQSALIVESEPRKGTTMQVLFPVSTSPVAAPRSTRSILRHRPELSGTALVADDDPMVLNLASDILKHHGMEVIQAPDGKVALDRFRANPMGFQVVLLDLTMPKLNGRDAFKAMREIRQDIPVIISSGYAEREALEHIGEHTSLGFIQKPYRTMELIEKIKNVLEGASIQVVR